MNGALKTTVILLFAVGAILIAMVLMSKPETNNHKPSIGGDIIDLDQYRENYRRRR